MQIKINIKNNKEYIHNLAFIKALLIKESIEKLDITNEILEYLKNN